MYVQRECENGHIKMMTRQGNGLKYKGKERTVRERQHENEEKSSAIYRFTRERADGVALRYCLLSQIGAFLRYSFLWVTSTRHHHSLFIRYNCVTLSAVMGVVPADHKSMSQTG
jgi:hypothetical protein